MIAVKDSMVLIHLAKVSLLEKSCDYFEEVIIPEMVYNEILKGQEKNLLDVPIIVKLINNKKILVKKVNDNKLVKNANQFNIQGGEAEVIALYWQEKADLIISDDDNIRKKRILLNIKVIGTPVVILKLFNEKAIDKQKAKECVSELRKVGWFGNTVLDKILMEVEK